MMIKAFNTTLIESKRKAVGKLLALQVESCLRCKCVEEYFKKAYRQACLSEIDVIPYFVQDHSIQVMEGPWILLSFLGFSYIIDDLSSLMYSILTKLS